MSDNITKNFLDKCAAGRDQDKITAESKANYSTPTLDELLTDKLDVAGGSNTVTYVGDGSSAGAGAAAAA